MFDVVVQLVIMPSIAETLGIPPKYLAYAGVAPPSNAVRQAVAATLDLVATQGPGAFPVLGERRERLRQSVARLIGAAADQVAFVPGTTRGLLELAWCLPWKSGERVVVFRGEFPANVSPWQRAAELFGLELEFVSLAGAVRDLEPMLAQLETALKKGVRLVAVSAVQFQTGLRMPLARISELCRRYGAELAVDAIQACGIVPLDVHASGIDYLACGAHKWLMGVEGAGFVYARDAGTLIPRTAGWLSHDDALGFLLRGPGELRYDRPLKSGIDFVEGSSSGSLALSALGASLDAILARGVEAIWQQVSRYLDRLEAGLVERGLVSLRSADPDARSGILSFEAPRSTTAAQIVMGLKARGVFASTPDGLIRFAPHYPNPDDEVLEILAALDAVLGR
jgi:selenocysteine lyase/cysteine desulfurase